MSLMAQLFARKSSSMGKSWIGTNGDIDQVCLTLFDPIYWEWLDSHIAELLDDLSPVSFNFPFQREILLIYGACNLMMTTQIGYLHLVFKLYRFNSLIT